MRCDDSMDISVLEKLEVTMKRIRSVKLSAPLRPMISEMNNLPRHTILVGPRGCGKTTLLMAEADHDCSRVCR